jgi:hypothetical protein
MDPLAIGLVLIMSLALASLTFFAWVAKGWYQELVWRERALSKQSEELSNLKSDLDRRAKELDDREHRLDEYGQEMAQKLDRPGPGKEARQRTVDVDALLPEIPGFSPGEVREILEAAPPKGFTVTSMVTDGPMTRAPFERFRDGLVQQGYIYGPDDPHGRAYCWTDSGHALLGTVRTGRLTDTPFDDDDLSEGDKPLLEPGISDT